MITQSKQPLNLKKIQKLIKLWHNLNKNKSFHRSQKKKKTETAKAEQTMHINQSQISHQEKTNHSQEKVLLIHDHACNPWFDRKWFAKPSHDISMVRN